MPADATMRTPRGKGVAGQKVSTSADEPSIMASRAQNFDTMTVGQLAAMIEEMQRMIVSIGAHLESRTQLVKSGDPNRSRVDEVLAPAEIEKLAAMLSAIERVRPA